MKTKSRFELQQEILKLGKAGKLKSPTSEVMAMPNWYLRMVIDLRK